MFKEPGRFVGRNVIRDAVVALLGFGYAFWAMVGSGQKTIAWGFLLLMAGLPVYVYLKWRQSRESADAKQHPAPVLLERSDAEQWSVAVGS
jgi:basic amino acid/polyamine antiporter, APA family